MSKSNIKNILICSREQYLKKYGEIEGDIIDDYSDDKVIGRCPYCGGEELLSISESYDFIEVDESKNIDICGSMDSEWVRYSCHSCGEEFNI